MEGSVLADTARVVPVPRLRTGSGAASRLLQDTAKDRAFNQNSLLHWRRGIGCRRGGPAAHDV